MYFNVYTTTVFGQTIRNVNVINGGGSCSSRAIINDELLYVNIIVVINNARTTYELYALKHYI